MISFLFYHGAMRVAVSSCFGFNLKVIPLFFFVRVQRTQSVLRARCLAMSCRVGADLADEALRVCTVVLLLREEFSGEGEYDWVAGVSKKSPEVSSLLSGPFSFEKYSSSTWCWQPKSRTFDAVQIVRDRKLNHEEQDRTTLLYSRISTRMRRNSKDLRVFCAVVCLLNSKEFAGYLDEATQGKKHLRGSTILRLAREFDGIPFTDSFDVRSRRLPPELMAKRKTSRLNKVMRLETKREVNLRKESFPRQMVCIQNRCEYGGLLGKNAVALLTVVANQVAGSSRGCLPGPGAESGLRFVSGESSGIGGGGTCHGVLAEEFDAAALLYDALHDRWIGMQSMSCSSVLALRLVLDG